MTTDSMPGDDPRRLLSDVRTLARRVRLDQRVTWVALLVLAVVTLLAIPIDWYDLNADCGSASKWIPGPESGGFSCNVERRGLMFYWPPALMLAYATIAVYAVRSARARGVGSRVMPYVLTGAALTALFTAVWLVFRHYLHTHGVPTEPFPGWVLLLDRLVGPAGTIGIGLLVLARLERNVALLVFTLGYLVLVLVPLRDYIHLAGWGYEGILGQWLPVQFINGIVLLLGAAGFARARRRQR
jgi:GNAT superfamily N-acetyltransferase